MFHYPTKLYSIEEIINDKNLIPKCNGIYFWWFKNLPSEIDLTNCKIFDGYHLLYVGIAPNNKDNLNSKSNLYTRILNHHCKGTARNSTLRKSLGCILYKYKKSTYPLRRVGLSNKMTFTKSGEEHLNKWMSENAKVCWNLEENPWFLENEIISNQDISLPLNIKANKHPYAKELSSIRKEAIKKAKEEPIEN